MRLAFISGMILMCLLAAGPASAAVFRVESDASTSGGRQATVYVDAEGAPLNAFEGRLTVVGSGASLLDASDGDSIVNLWIERPRVGDDGAVRFSGLTPGGFSGSSGRLLTVNFVAPQGATLEIHDASALLNDGRGTAASLRLIPLEAPPGDDHEASPAVAPDTMPPETFRPELVDTNVAFEGQRTVVFAAQDKGWGIGRYEVCEGVSACETASSPYILKNQAFTGAVTVRAYDKAGNIRSATIDIPPRSSRWREIAPVKIMLAACLLLALTLIISFLLCGRFCKRR